MTAVKRIFRYLKETLDHGLWYDRFDDLTLYAFTDIDWAGSVDDRKNTSPGAFFLGRRLVPWLSKKQGRISTTAESKYVAAAINCTRYG